MWNESKGSGSDRKPDDNRARARTAAPLMSRRIIFIIIMNIYIGNAYYIKLPYHKAIGACGVIVYTISELV